MNLFRARLANVAAVPQGFPAEPIDPSFRVLQLPDPINRIRRIIFGSVGDPDFCLYRVAQFMPCVYASSLSSAVTQVDPINTDDPLHPALIPDSYWGVTVNFSYPGGMPVGGNYRVVPVGRPVSPDASGQSRVEFTLAGPTGTAPVNVQLPGTGYYLGYFDPLGVSRVTHTIYAAVHLRPQRDIGDITIDVRSKFKNEVAGLAAFANSLAPLAKQAVSVWTNDLSPTPEWAAALAVLLAVAGGGVNG